MFWCLYGREKTNIRDGKYLGNCGYKHPLWNYGDMKNKYPDNIIDIDIFVDDIFQYIDPDGSIHPNIAGFKLLSNVIENLKW